MLSAFRIFAAVIVLSITSWAAPNRYALILQDDPAVSVATSHTRSRNSPEAAARRQTLVVDQAGVKREVHSRKLRSTGSAQTLLNAVFVEAPQASEADLRSIPGVKAVVRLSVRHPNLDRAAPLINAPAAWTALGGIPNAGLGIKIGILDTGIDQTHPAFSDTSLPPVTPICSGSDCAFTNGKVIVARSYVRQLGVGSTVDPATSRPDDFSPRDHVGHGTAVASVAAGYTNTGPSGTITGIAPKAYLGNYKIYGTNGINGGATDDVIIQATEDAFNDGMDIINFSSGSYAFTGPLDSGAACGNPAGVACDPLAAVFENAVKNGMVVVASAGNEGNAGQQIPTLATVNSPANAPGVIAVAATTNSHTFFSGIRINGSGAPQNIVADFGDGPVPAMPLTALLKDAASTGDAQACSALPLGSLTGYIAIAQQHSQPGCLFVNQVTNAERAGALAIIFTSNSNGGLFTPSGLSGTEIPSLVISQSDGQSVCAFLAADGAASATVDPYYLVAADATPNLVASFSSRGPNLIAGTVKPDIAAVGTDLYMAAERTDPSGDIYSANGYSVASGTSFSSPLTAGAAALVKQANKTYSPQQIRSALVNTATQDVLDGTLPAGVETVGAGKLNAGNAIAASVTVTPSSVYFGALNGQQLPHTTSLLLTNSGSAGVNLSLSVPSGKGIALDKSSVTIAPGQAATLNVTLAGSLPTPGNYEGLIAISGAHTPLVVPFQYVLGDEVPFNIVALAGDQNYGTVGQAIPDGVLALQITDRYGVPVSNAPASFRAQVGGGSISQADSVTNQYGIAMAIATLGPAPGNQTFVGQAGGLTWRFRDSARAVPTIFSGGVVNAATSQAGNGISPGSFVTLYGSGLSDVTDVANTPALPFALDDVSVSFDVPSANLSVAGHVYYVSPGQVNVQVPWELAGQTSVQMKVSINQTSGSVITVPVSTYDPAFFVYGNSLAAALDENSTLIGASNPAKRGHIISVFANGLGPVSNQPASGDPAPSSPPATTQAVPAVTLGGLPAAVQFSGLSPQAAALYQLNIVVPPNVPIGLQPLVMTVNGVVSNTAELNVQ